MLLLVKYIMQFLVRSDVAVNEKLLRLFFPGAVGDIQRLQARYASECKVPNEGEKKFGEGLQIVIGV